MSVIWVYFFIRSKLSLERDILYYLLTFFNVTILSTAFMICAASQK